MSELCFTTAAELAAALRGGELSAVEVLEAHLEQIDRVNPQVNAIVTLDVYGARATAETADARLAAGEAPGPLHGVPVAVKDTVDTRGLRTTYGSPIFAGHVPDRDALVVERLRAAGAVIVGKTNAPEFGAGSQTFNAVFGATLNPWDTTRTCGGSSGGAAVALACGMAALADGTDLGGSLRNPASFCNVVGLRPSPGRVPSWPTTAAWFPFAVHGPMGRTVADVALLLSVLAGPDPRVVLALTDPGAAFASPLQRDLRGVRVAFSEDLGGLPVDPAVRAVLAGAPALLESLGCVVETAAPDFTGAEEAFTTWRAWYFEQNLGELLDEHRDQLKDTVVWNIEQGRALTGPQIGAAERGRSALAERIARFMERFDFLALPVSQVAPFDVREPYPTKIDGVAMESYIDWMRSCSWITVTALPAISVPCGFTGEGLPVGLQLVGRPRDDRGVLELAYAFEQATGLTSRRPPLAVTPEATRPA